MGDGYEELLQFVRATLLSPPSQCQRFLFPGTSDERRHFHCAIIRPQDAQHLSAVVIHVEPVWQIRLRVLSLDRVSIAWRRCLAGSQVIEWRPVPEDPGAHPELDQPYGVTLNFERPVLAQERQNMITDRKRPDRPRMIPISKSCPIRRRPRVSIRHRPPPLNYLATRATHMGTAPRRWG